MDTSSFRSNWEFFTTVKQKLLQISIQRNKYILRSNTKRLSPIYIYESLLFNHCIQVYFIFPLFFHQITIRRCAICIFNAQHSINLLYPLELSLNSPETSNQPVVTTQQCDENANNEPTENSAVENTQEAPSKRPTRKAALKCRKHLQNISEML